MMKVLKIIGTATVFFISLVAVKKVATGMKKSHYSKAVKITA